MPWITLVGIALFLGVLLAGAASFLWDIGVRWPLVQDWPEATFIYEREQMWGGDRKLITRYRLTYCGRNDWYEEALPSEPVVLPHGTFPQPRGTRRMEGRLYTEHDQDTGLTETEVIGENTTFSPSGWFLPIPFALHESHLRGSPRRVKTDARVCFRAGGTPGDAAGMLCDDSGPAWRFDVRSSHIMLLDDRRGIPVGSSSFKMIEVRVEDHQKPVEWSPARAALEMREDWRRAAALWWFFVVY